jgi:hypothetical protein
MAAYDTKLPMIDSHCGRTSLSHTMNALQLVSSPLIERNIVKDFPSDKPILLIVTDTSLTKDERLVISKGKFIATEGVLFLYELPLTSLDPPFHQARKDFLLNKDSLRRSGNLLFHSEKNDLVYSHQLVAGNPFDSGLKKKSDTIQLFNDLMSGADTSTTYEASIWNRVFTDSYESPELVVRQFDSKNKMIQELVSIPKEEPDNAYGWLRQHVDFKLTDLNSRVEIFIRGKRIEANYFLLRPATLDVYDRVATDSSFWLNNYFIPPPSEKALHH